MQQNKDDIEERFLPISEHYIIEGRQYILTSLGLERCLIPKEKHPESQVLEDIERMQLPEDIFYLIEPIEDILTKT